MPTDTDLSVSTEGAFLSDEEEANADRPWLFSKENAAEMGRRGGKVSGERRGPRTLATIRANKDELFNELYCAATGRGDWKELPIDKRLGALKLLLEYAEGRPTPRTASDDEPTQEDGGGWEIGEAQE